MFTKQFKVLPIRYLISSEAYYDYFKSGLVTVWDGTCQKADDNFKYFYINGHSLAAYMGEHVKMGQAKFISNKDSGEVYYGVCFGSGTTPATEDDYCMEGDLFTNYTYSQTYEYGNGSVTYKYTLTNNGDEPFTIGEIGIVTDVRSAVSSNSPVYKSMVLLERTVLESPITIPANGGVGQIAYTLKMDGLE